MHHQYAQWHRHTTETAKGRVGKQQAGWGWHLPGSSWVPLQCTVSNSFFSSFFSIRPSSRKCQRCSRLQLTTNGCMVDASWFNCGLCEQALASDSTAAAVPGTNDVKEEEYRVERGRGGCQGWCWCCCYGYRTRQHYTVQQLLELLVLSPARSQARSNRNALNRPCLHGALIAKCPNHWCNPMNQENTRTERNRRKGCWGRNRGNLQNRFGVRCQVR